MVPPATSTPTRRREGVWRESHHSSSAQYPYDYEAMSPNPYGSNRGPPPPAPYHYDSQGPPPRGPLGPPPTEYWHSPSPYSSEHQHPPPPLAHRSSGGPYWTPLPPPPFDGYREGPSHLGSQRGPPHGNMPHSSHQHRTPLRRPYSGEQQVGLELKMVPPPSPRDHHMFHHNHHHKDFSPPAPAPAIGQVPPTRSVQVAVSASADSEEAPHPHTANETIAVNATSKKKGGLDNDDAVVFDDGSDSKTLKKEKGDPLSVLADVSAGLGGKNKKSKQGYETGEAETTAPKGGDSSDSDISGSASDHHSMNDGGNHQLVSMPAPASPLQRRLKPSPITPSQTPQLNSNSNKRTSTKRKHQPITPSRSHDTTSSNEGLSQSLQPSWETPQLSRGGSSGGGGGELYSSHPEYNNFLQQSDGSYNSPSRRNRSRMHYGSVGEFGPPFPPDSPALVERGSFDSHCDASSYRGAPPYPPSTPTLSRGGAYFYDNHAPPPPPGYGSSGTGSGGSYWDSGQSPYSPTYPPPNRGGGGWNQAYPPLTHSDSFYGPPPHHGPPPDYSYPPPPPHHGGHEDHNITMYGGKPPSHSSYHHRGPPPPLSGPHHPDMLMHPPHMGGPPPPYPYGHSPRMEEKTILRKKFSWKHYPELERFLIANRDEYLKHSNMNYTAEQKQYNNWLTERLLEVASQHNYMFDPEEFNFVAIRDRIRCYYKSYVQTARKRGLKLPEKTILKSKVAVKTEPKKE